MSASSYCNNLPRLRRHNGKPFLAFRLRPKFAIMLEDHLRAISGLERYLGGILEDRDPVTDERMS